MFSQHTSRTSEPADTWLAFPGGELEGRQPKVMCPACRDRSVGDGTLCFQCYRAELSRERKLKEAAGLDTASEARFQSSLPFEPVNTPRLNRLRAERLAARAASVATPEGRLEDRQRRAQIAARHAIQRVRDAWTAQAVKTVPTSHLSLSAALHAAELQLPESWLPYVVSR